MTNTGAVTPVFHEGDEVVLVEGPYQGTLGVFVRLKNDVAWADVAERNGEVRSHPLIWLGHAGEGGASSATPGTEDRRAGIK